jgi:hypothetical protein
VWSFDDVITSRGTRRSWSFTSSDRKHRALLLATVDGNDGGVQKFADLFEFAVEKPATLVLKNVNLTYEGTYQFGLSPADGVGTSDVGVFITGKFLLYNFVDCMCGLSAMKEPIDPDKLMDTNCY